MSFPLLQRDLFEALEVGPVQVRRAEPYTSALSNSNLNGCRIAVATTGTERPTIGENEHDVANGVRTCPVEREARTLKV